MTEGFPKHEAPKTPEPLSPEWRKIYLETYPYKGGEVPQLNHEQIDILVQEYKGLCSAFERTHSMDQLFSIQVHTVEEAKACEPREAAKKDLIPIVAYLNFLEKQERISEESFVALCAPQRRMQAAVGALNSGQLDHEIRTARIRVD